MKKILVAVVLIASQAMAEAPKDVAVAASSEAVIRELPTPVIAQASEASTEVAAEIASPAVTATSQLSENEIPVQLEGTKKAASSESPIFKFIMSLSVLGVLGAGAYFFIRKYTQKSNKQAQATQIKVLSQHYLGPKKSLAIVRVAGESILIGITDHNVNMIKSLSLLDDEVPEETPKNFQSIFSKKNQEQNQNDLRFSSVENDVDGEPKEEFSMTGIKDFVSSRLKNMRNLE